MKCHKRLLGPVVMCVLAFAISGCGKPKYSLTVTVAPAEIGSVAQSGGPLYSKGTVVTLTPVANEGWLFDSWGGPDAGDVVESNGQWFIVVDADKALTAVFRAAPSVAPNAADDTATVDEDDSIAIDVLSNDSGADGDVLVIDSFSQGSNGTVVTEGTLLRYTPAPNYHGIDSFTYTIGDGKGGTDTATVNVTVSPVNDQPVANTESAELLQFENTLIDVLANDTDADGDTLTVSSFSQGSHGLVAIEGTSIRYTPNSDFYGNDTFTYTASDGCGGTATVLVNVTVIGPVILLAEDYSRDEGITGFIPFIVTRAGQYRVQTSHYLLDCDTDLCLYDADKQLITSNDDYSDYYSCIIRHLEPGTYYIQVREVTFSPLYFHLEVRLTAI